MLLSGEHLLLREKRSKHQGRFSQRRCFKVIFLRMAKIYQQRKMEENPFAATRHNDAYMTSCLGVFRASWQWVILTVYLRCSDMKVKG